MNIKKLAKIKTKLFKFFTIDKGQVKHLRINKAMTKKYGRDVAWYFAELCWGEERFLGKQAGKSKEFFYPSKLIKEESGFCSKTQKKLRDKLVAGRFITTEIKPNGPGYPKTHFRIILNPNTINAKKTK